MQLGFVGTGEITFASNLKIAMANPTNRPPFLLAFTSLNREIREPHVAGRAGSPPSRGNGTELSYVAESSKRKVQL